MIDGRTVGVFSVPVAVNVDGETVASRFTVGAFSVPVAVNADGETVTSPEGTNNTLIM